MDVVEFIRENQNYFEDFITRSTYHSNAIEGNTLSYAETYAILFNDNDFEVKAKPREIYEAINHKYALSYIMQSVEEGEELSEQMIKKLAMQINKNIMEIADYHIQFERIHPFEDGNGRTGRLLINYELLRNNLFPIVIPKEDRANYFELISSQNIAGLGELFSKFEKNEKERVEYFQAQAKEVLKDQTELLKNCDMEL